MMIPCAFDCVHQNDGICTLDKISVVSCSKFGICAYYKKKNPCKNTARTVDLIDARFKSLTDSTNTDNFD